MAVVTGLFLSGLPAIFASRSSSRSSRFGPRRSYEIASIGDVRVSHLGRFPAGGANDRRRMLRPRTE